MMPVNQDVIQTNDDTCIHQMVRNCHSLMPYRQTVHLSVQNSATKSHLFLQLIVMTPCSAVPFFADHFQFLPLSPKASRAAVTLQNVVTI